MSSLPKGWICLRCGKSNAPQVLCCDCDPNPLTAERSPAQVRKKRVERPFVPPLEIEVITFFTDNGFPAALGSRAWKHYELGGWTNSQGRPVKNWKQTMHTNWMKDEYKVSIQRSTKSDEESKFGKPTYL